MGILKRRAACLLAAMALIAASAQLSLAAGVVLKNDMELDIKAVLCVDDEGKTKQAFGELKAGQSATVPADKFPEHECQRLAVHTAEGNGWQYYQEAEPGGAKEITFSMDKANPNGEESYPSLLIESGDETYVTPAGVPLLILAQLMQFGLDEAKWKEIATPGLESFENTTSYAFSFADVSWDLVEDGLVFAELIPGHPELVDSVTMTTKFSNTTVLAALEGLKSLGASPCVLSFNEKTAALTEEGKKLEPDAELMDDTKTDESRWEAVNSLLEVASAATNPDLLRMVFSDENCLFELVLDLNEGTAVLTVTRKADAAFG